MRADDYYVGRFMKSGVTRHIVTIEITRAFVNLRQLLASNVDLSRRLDELKSKYDKQFRVVSRLFDN